MKQQKISTSARIVELRTLTRNADGTFDIEYVELLDMTPAQLSPKHMATVPENGVPYWQEIGGIPYAFVCDRKTGEHLGIVCDCGFRSYTETGSTCQGGKGCKRVRKSK